MVCKTFERGRVAMTKGAETNVYINGKHIGFKSGDRLFLQHCPKCNMENYAMAVSSGECAWCGHKPEIKDVETKKK